MSALKTTVISIFAAGVLIVAVAFYRSCRSGHNLDIDPHARQEIDKAMHK
jgi:biopolymer transport protein ExbB/TolQ